MPLPPVPQHCPTPRELDDLELLVTGALVPTVAFNEPGSPVTLELPAPVAAQASAAGAVELVDPEGLPLAQVEVPGGTIEPLTHAQYGPFRRYYLTPRETRERFVGRTFVPLVTALTQPQLTALSRVGPLVLLPLVGHGTPDLSPVALMRATIAAAEHLPDAEVVAVPLAARGDAEADHELGVQVTGNYAGEDPVVGVTDDPTGAYPPEIATIVEQDRPAPDRQGLVLFFTGLSGSGKSTLARALMDRLLEHGVRTLTSLDGDVVRRNLSAGLTFSKEDRETNIRRIGWVAAEISRHGGVAVCSPIAPFDTTRKQVRSMVEDAGGAFFLVHVATPLEECERRDRKGLYAKARRGEIPEFTGISSPYEEPEDADVRVDTTGRTIEDALGDVLVALRTSGHLDLTDPDPADAPAIVEIAAASDTAPVVEVRGAPATSLENPASSPDVRPATDDPLGGRVASASERIETPAPEAPTQPPLNVLFVCTANICRSPFMELLSRHLVDPEASISFSSAGTHGFLSSEMDPVMAETLSSRGVSTTAFRSRPFATDMLAHADLVLTAEAAHRQFILDDHPASFRKVFTLGQFAEAVRAAGPDLVGRDLLDAVGSRRGPSDPTLDIPDPYGRGPEPAEECAVALEELLRVVLPALTGSRSTAS
ncbi:adenylyl-sulfate kinase [Nocardioides sp.]|uniref:adenylyl-sulfate kinase n=1 Tax=Nocardioides sp. TaxID=35761 RepID=UPI003784B615